MAVISILRPSRQKPPWFLTGTAPQCKNVDVQAPDVEEPRSQSARLVMDAVGEDVCVCNGYVMKNMTPPASAFEPAPFTANWQWWVPRISLAVVSPSHIAGEVVCVCNGYVMKNMTPPASAFEPAPFTANWQWWVPRISLAVVSPSHIAVRRSIPPSPATPPLCLSRSFVMHDGMPSLSVRPVMNAAEEDFCGSTCCVMQTSTPPASFELAPFTANWQWWVLWILGSLGVAYHDMICVSSHIAVWRSIPFSPLCLSRSRVMYDGVPSASQSVGLLVSTVGEDDCETTCCVLQTSAPPASFDPAPFIANWQWWALWILGSLGVAYHDMICVSGHIVMWGSTSSCPSRSS